MTKTGSNAAEFTATTSPATNCGGTLAAGATCTISVTFKPTTTGVRVAVLTFTSSGLPNQTVNLVGNPPVAAVTPASLAFGNVAEGTAAPFKTVTLSNTALYTSMSFTGVTVADAINYQIGSNCPATMPPNSHCTITVSVDPQKVGTINSTLTIHDNHLNNASATQNVTLTTNGTGAPFAVVSTTSLDFSLTPRVQGDTSGTIPSQTFTITNKGTSALTFNIGGSNVNTFGNLDFTRVPASLTPCGTSLGAGASCNVTIRFTPQVLNRVGQRTGVLSINNNSGITNAVQVEVLLIGKATGAPRHRFALRAPALARPA